VRCIHVQTHVLLLFSRKIFSLCIFAVAYDLPSVIVVIVCTNNPFRGHLVLFFFFCFFLPYFRMSFSKTYKVRRNDDVRVLFTAFSLCYSNPRFKYVFLSFFLSISSIIIRDKSFNE
jgi:hypothetical protein